MVFIIHHLLYATICILSGRFEFANTHTRPSACDFIKGWRLPTPTNASDIPLQHQYAPTTIEMPRIPTSLLRQAHTIDPLLPSLLAPCRDLQAARNELRWLREYVERVAKARQARGDILAKGALLRQMIKERVMGKPLQYIMGSEYFGDLEIRCSPGVLIPRWVPIVTLE
jgi:hypothetical protein